MTYEEMKQILETKIPFSDLVKNSGIYDFYEKDNIGIAISYEDYEHGVDTYIYNLFWLPDEYINISSEGFSDNPITDEIINELVEAWNDLES